MIPSGSSSSSICFFLLKINLIDPLPPPRGATFFSDLLEGGVRYFFILQRGGGMKHFLPIKSVYVPYYTPYFSLVIGTLLIKMP